MKTLLFTLLLAVPALAQQPFNAHNIKLDAVPVQGTAGNVARIFSLNAQGLGESITPTKNWEAIVLTGQVDTSDISGFSVLGRALVDDLTTDDMQNTLGATTVGKAFFTTANPSAITFVRVNANNSISYQTAANYRTDIGGSTIGQAYFTLTNPSAITFPRQNANNSVTSRTAVELKTDLSLENVNNTSDANKPVSTATQTALNLKLDATDGVAGGTLSAANIRYSGLISFNASAGTLPSAATIAPSIPVTFVSGVVAIDTITPPAAFQVGGGQLTLIPTGTWTTTTSGNIALASTAVVNRAMILTFDFATGKWYPSY